MIIVKPYYKSSTGKLTDDGKVIPDSGELLGYCVFRVEPKEDSHKVPTHFVTQMIDGPMSEDEAIQLVSKMTNEVVV